MGLLALGEGELLVLREVEEGTRRGSCLRNELLRYAVPDDGQEPDLTACPTDLADDAGALGGEVDDGHRHSRRV
jgi:hypothetical protein